MKLFECQACSQVLYFENVSCEVCEHPLGYLPERTTLSALEPAGEGWTALAEPGKTWRRCVNYQHDVCNWMLPADASSEFCLACSLNRTIPPLDNPENVRLWRYLELAKHRLIYSLLRLGLPVDAKIDGEGPGLAFDFLAPLPDGDPVMTGHANGLVTINLAEADPVVREQSRTSMGERYRTLLGHFRHEIGHYYWEVLILSHPGRLQQFRKLFGDDQQDYGKALELHYEHGPRGDWQQGFISTYASAHPWEDWAETWAHYLHLVDTLETAFAFGIELRPRVRDKSLRERISFDPHRQEQFAPILDSFVPLSQALNSLNRSMGQPDAYPFILSAPVMQKLEFIHQAIREHKAGK